MDSFADGGSLRYCRRRTGASLRINLEDASSLAQDPQSTKEIAIHMPRLFPQSRPTPSSAVVLAMVLTCQLMLILDVSVVITALPKIQNALGFSSAGLSWVQNAYTLAFGGLLLLGARAGDILGRRRVFVVGIALFTAASLLGGLAQSELWLLAARTVQGIGAAIAATSTLALLTLTFREGSVSTRALTLYRVGTVDGGHVGLALV